jgi:Tol biopolymer transport system component
MFYRFIRIWYLVLIIFGRPGFINGQALPIKPERTVSFTTSEGSYMNVDVSSDGKQLLFDLVGDIHLVSAQGGRARQLTHGIGLKSQPIWLPDGKTFSYISDSSGELRRYKQSMDKKKTYCNFQICH